MSIRVTKKIYMIYIDASEYIIIISLGELKKKKKICYTTRSVLHFYYTRVIQDYLFDNDYKYIIY